MVFLVKSFVVMVNRGKTMSVITDVESLANQLPALIETQKAALAAKQSEMETLKNAGLIYANEHWRSGKYLYLIYPSHDGQRERKYIGANPAKIEAAEASIHRANEDFKKML